MMKSISCILLICLLSLMGYAEETQGQQIERLIKQLKGSDSDVRANAAVALGEIGPEAKDAVPALIEALQDPDTSVRANAAMALEEIGLGAKDATRQRRRSVLVQTFFLVVILSVFVVIDTVINP